MNDETRQAIAEIRKQYTDKYVQVDITVPELARFAGMTGRVVTVNENRLALVDFSDGPWYDLPLEHLRIVPKPAPKPAAAHAAPAKPAAKPKPAPKTAAKAAE